MKTVLKAILIAALTCCSGAFAQTPIKEKNIVINPNSLELQKKLDEFRESIPDLSVRKVKIKPDGVKVIITRPNFWTVVRFHLGTKVDYVVGNPSVYEVKKVGNDTLLIRPSKKFVNSNLVVTAGGKAYQFLLTQSLKQLDGIVEVYPARKVNYEKELQKVLSGGKSPYVRVVPYREGGHYDRVISVNGKTLGVIYVRQN